MTAAAVTTSAGVSKGIYAAFGLSPLTRGTHALYEIFRTDNWFIPATAGNTTAATSVRTAATVYPRYRGEHFNGDQYRHEDNGLSPLPRGTHNAYLRTQIKRRFIPATAGNTHYHLIYDRTRAVYPRYRGEHGTARYRRRQNNGLSPLPRGTRQSHAKSHRPPRFIPATAGNTSIAGSFPVVFSVYPRYRGEHLMTSFTTIIKNGLSPLPRGTR